MADPISIKDSDSHPISIKDSDSLVLETQTVNSFSCFYCAFNVFTVQCIRDSVNSFSCFTVHLKGHWTNSASSPNFFQKSWDFYAIGSVYLCSDCMLNLTCKFNLITKIIMWIFLAAAICKSLPLKMAATVMTVEFGTILHYSSLEENSEACLCSSLNRYKKKK